MRELQDQSWQRFSTPADGWAGRVGTKVDVNIRTYQLPSSFKTRLHQIQRHLAGAELRAPGNRQDSVSIVLEPQDFLTPRCAYDNVVRLKDCRGAARTRAQHAIVLEDDGRSV